MKRAWTYLLVLCLLLPCAADAAKARDASGVTASGGRLRGDIVGVSGESGETALALRVDCPIPPEFTPEQLAVLTTEWIVPDETAVGEAMRATGADWSDGALKRFGPAFAAGSAAPLSPAASGTDADGAREQARATALSFLLDCGLSEGHVIHLLRPEDEARLYALNEAPETRAAQSGRMVYPPGGLHLGTACLLLARPARIPLHLDGGGRGWPQLRGQPLCGR